MIHNVFPDSREIFHQLGLASLGVEVGHACIQIVRSYGVPHCLVLVAQLMTVLIMIFAISHAVTDGDEALRQCQVFLVARLTVHLRRTHIVTWTDGVP